MPANVFEKSHNNANNQLHAKFASESFALYLSHTVRTFAQALIGVFLPLYIFKLSGKPILYMNEFTNDLAWVLLFFIIRSIALLIFITPVTNLIFGKLNFKKSIFISNIAVSLSLVFILFADRYFWLIPLTAIAASFDIILYWIPFHLFFIRKSQSSDGHFGKQFGIRLFLTKLASSFGPIIGGLLIIALGFKYLFFKRYISEKNLIWTSTAFAVIAFEDIVYSILWPLLLLTLTGSFAKLGIITTVSISISAIFAVYIGKIIDKNGPKLIHKIGVIFNSLLHFSRIFANQTLFAILVDISDKLNGSLYSVPFNSITYDVAKKEHYDSDFIIYREIIMHIGIACGLFILLIILPMIPDYKKLFVVIGIITPLTYLINVKKK